MFTLPDLPYNYNALEPFIDEKTMQLHHDAHHAVYVKNLNDVLANFPDLLDANVEDLIKNLGKIPEEIRTKVRNNGGQHANHSLFWVIMAAPSQQNIPSGNLLDEINKNFESFDKFKDKFTSSAVALFGSGWIWLNVNDGRLEISTTPNGDSPIMQGKVSLLNLDVWEHAYYLKYQNKRKDYIDAWWSVVNWKEVEKRFEKLI